MKSSNILSECLVLLAFPLSVLAAKDPPPVVFENAEFRLTVGADAQVRSLVVKSTGEDCVMPGEDVPLFSVTQERPFNNEIKLTHPNVRTTYPANRLRRDGDRLTVGFALAPYEAYVTVVERPGYIAFRLEDFSKGGYDGLKMDTPPVAEFRVAQLPVRDRRNFGDWLNVMWDDRAFVGVIGTSCETFVGHEDRHGWKALNADLRTGYRLRGGSAAIVAAGSERRFLDCVAAVECDYGLPKGVEGRRNPLLNASVFWVSDLTPKNVDEYIAWAKRGGFRLMLLYYTCVVKESGSWGLNGNWDYRDEYPNGEADLKRMLEKIRAAGIEPGLHFLHTHVGLKSRYVTPVADHRLGLRRTFTLAQPLTPDSTDLVVEENPVDSPSYDGSRILRFGGELISYDGFTTERPYRFTGVRRGAHETRTASHPRGEIGGVLDVSEYGRPMSCYVDQRMSLQDEIADKIAAVYGAGFRFVYMDGSEGVNAPFEYHVPNAQYRVWRKLKPEPIFAEAAAKAHFDWHILTGANAFDIFPPETFKAKIVEFPQAEAPLMRKNFSRVDFGWWGFWAPSAPGAAKRSVGTQLDMWEFGTSRAAAWDSPMAIQMRLDRLRLHPRAADIFEMVRRWEDVRAKGWLTAEQKVALRSPTQEHHLYPDGKGGYELHPIEMLPTPAKAPDVRGFVFERGGRRVIACWHVSGECDLALPLAEGPANVRLGNLRYFETSASLGEAKSAFAAAAVAAPAGEGTGTG